MRRQILALAVLAAGALLIADTGAEAQGRSKEYGVCQPQFQPLCMAGWTPRCTSSGWRCVAPDGYGAAQPRQHPSCLANMTIQCMAPALPHCRDGRWVCVYPGG